MNPHFDEHLRDLERRASSDAVTILLLLEMLRSHLRDAPSKADLLELEKKIMASQAELVATVKGVTEQLKKTNGEINGLQTEVTTLKDKIVELEKIIADGNATPELVAAVAELKAQAQVVDDAIPDIVTPPPPPV